ncbi:serine/threonine protein kinase [Eremomyces bilateralis CBS 781.70]|uniref:non-specific serine/threonine protein kinase n=1 Tax=Eremomyces bilateralis CBS 781.70 TaxID=1392243 RepID=A0A6G1G935_9PEZI|nr:serine/threonine protein kinase [Eremomyces bilateralis CBS 781.70]KAF1814502.1 serine/threonine protein kinase [Eremomyces bilateralis CBS 781.70]
MYLQSQVEEPINLPFRLVSGTIGQGAYAFIRKACPLKDVKPIIAVKFINKEQAFRIGRLTQKKLENEVILHKHLGKHQNIIECIGFGGDPSWLWIQMELAEGGDLFDKIEADEGVGDRVAHLYFTQLINAVSYMHDKGIAHRDLKPENILLSGGGNLKLADFGLATLFRHRNIEKRCTTVCGSPPYIAPEVLAQRSNKKGNELESGYQADKVDIWSCGIVLFVLLVGNTPWDEPTMNSYEFMEFVKLEGRTTDELWTKLDSSVTSLLRGMLKLDSAQRFSLQEVRTHPWFTERNPYLDARGRIANPVVLATQMLESLHIDFDSKPTFTPHRMDAMDMDQPQISMTQPETLVGEMSLDWERVPHFQEGVSLSQPTDIRSGGTISHSLLSYLAEDPSLSQFTATPAVPLTLTQQARHFKDIMPSFSLTRFVSPRSLTLLLPLLKEAMHRLGIPATERITDSGAVVEVKTIDGRKQALAGAILVERYNNELLEVRFLKKKGDPLEWRRLFKKVVILCKDAIAVPEH